MATIPVPQLGKDLTAVALIPQAVSAAGVLSDGTSVNLLAKMRGLRLSTTVERTEINAMNTTRQNEVILSTGRSLSLDIFLVNNGTDPNPLETAIESADYFKVTWTVGSATGSIEAYTFYGVRGSLELNLEGRGEHIASLELGPVDIGAAQVSRSVS